MVCYACPRQARCGELLLHCPVPSANLIVERRVTASLRNRPRIAEAFNAWWRHAAAAVESALPLSGCSSSNTAALTPKSVTALMSRSMLTICMEECCRTPIARMTAPPKPFRAGGEAKRPSR